MLRELTEIKSIRKKLGLTQSELAKKAGVSQSLIAKLEAGLLDPGYSRTKQIFDALETLSNEEELEARQIMNKKIITVRADEKVDVFIKDMKKYGISQVPVVEKEKVVGLVTENLLLNVISQGRNISQLTVKDIMEDCPPIIAPNTKLSVVTSLLRHFPIAIVADKGNLLGLITKSDLIEKVI